MNATPAEAPLIPREVLFGNPDKFTATLAPRGGHMTYIAPLDGVLNIWLRTPGEEDRPLTRDTGRGVHFHYWCYDGVHVLYQQDRDGDENYLLYAVNIEDGTARCLTPPEPGDAHPIKMEVESLIPENSIADLSPSDRSEVC